MVKKVAVLGAGNGGYATAADLVLRGFHVNMWEFPFLRSNIEPILKYGGIMQVGDGAEKGFAKIGPTFKVTTNIKGAIEEAEVILSTMPAFGHSAWAKLGGKHLKDGQTVILCGKGGTSLEFAKVLKEAEIDKDILLGDTNTFHLEACRIVGPATVRVWKRFEGPLIAAFPAKNTDKLLGTMRALYADRPEFGTAAANVLHTMFIDYNATTHPTAILCNAARIEYSKGNFIHWKEGWTTSVARYTGAIDKERNELMKRFDLTPPPIRDPEERVKSLASEQAYMEIKAPPTLSGRYVLEDLPYGLVTFASIADMLGIPTPVTNSTITVIEALTGLDFWKPGKVDNISYIPRTVDRLGITGMTVDQIKKFVTYGEA